jgi:hypothetical protein
VVRIEVDDVVVDAGMLIGTLVMPYENTTLQSNTARIHIEASKVARFCNVALEAARYCRCDRDVFKLSVVHAQRGSNMAKYQRGRHATNTGGSAPRGPESAAHNYGAGMGDTTPTNGRHGIDTTGANERETLYQHERHGASMEGTVPTNGRLYRNCKE